MKSPRRVNGQDYINVSQKDRIGNWKKIKLGRASNYILMCVTRANKTGTYIKGGKKKLKSLEDQFWRVCFTSELPKHGSDKGFNGGKFSWPAWEGRSMLKKCVYHGCLPLGPGISSFLEYRAPHIECGIEYGYFSRWALVSALPFPLNQLCELAPHVGIKHYYESYSHLSTVNLSRDGLRGPTGLILIMNWHLELSVFAEILDGFSRGRVAGKWLQCPRFHSTCIQASVRERIPFPWTISRRLHTDLVVQPKLRGVQVLRLQISSVVWTHICLFTLIGTGWRGFFCYIQCHNWRSSPRLQARMAMRSIAHALTAECLVL